jgi:hypothetical protein
MMYMMPYIKIPPTPMVKNTYQYTLSNGCFVVLLLPSISFLSVQENSEWP